MASGEYTSKGGVTMRYTDAQRRAGGRNSWNTRRGVGNRETVSGTVAPF